MLLKELYTPYAKARFNPCFNGFMDKCSAIAERAATLSVVSTLVLMDSWINALLKVCS